MRPAPRLVAALALLAVIGGLDGVGVGVVPDWTTPAASLLVLGVALADALRLARLPSPSFARSIPHAWPLGVRLEITLALEVADGPLALELHDGHPGGWPVDGLPQRLELRPGTTRLTYHLRPEVRGAAVFTPADAQLCSPLRLWTQHRVLGAREAVRVYPNFRAVALTARLGAERAGRVSGVHLQRRRGEGTEFEQLREYRVGDGLRQVDWKATARTGRLISRTYRDERNQRVVLVLDIGRRMIAKDGPQSHLDHCLDAAAFLAHFALRNGDAVGLQTCGGTDRWVPPQRGPGAERILLEALHDLQPSPGATDMLSAAVTLAARQRRRALVLIMTNLRDEDSEDMQEAVGLLRRRHVVQVASLRESALDARLAGPVGTLEQAISTAGAFHYLEAREAAHRRLRKIGVPVLDTTCAGLPAALLRQYLAAKRAGAL